MKIHTVLAAHSETFPCVDLRGWNTFVQKAEILDDFFKMSDCDVIFAQASVDECLSRH